MLRMAFGRPVVWELDRVGDAQTSATVSSVPASWRRPAVASPVHAFGQGRKETPLYGFPHLVQHFRLFPAFRFLPRSSPAHSF
jgi:hypothetical protein